MDVAKFSPMRERVNALQALMVQMPQVELQTDHLFADGMYARIVARKAGTTIVGKVHLKEHFYIVASGRVRVTGGEEETVEYAAPTVLVSKAGTKRAVYALEDSVCLTVHRTDKTDLGEIEAELVEPDETALFNASNELKRIAA
jgi:hypothetical protein